MANFMLVRHEVEDFNAWKHDYEAHRRERVKAGVSEKYILQSDSNPNEVVVLFEADNLNRARAFAQSADLRESMEHAGVKDKPDIFYLHD